MTTLFISDLHLDATRPAITQLFLDFLKNEFLLEQDSSEKTSQLPKKASPKAKSLYILGDLFEAWIGDDVASPLSQQVSAQLKAVADSGVEIAFIAGNRDFLLGSSYAEQAGFTVLPEVSVIDLYGQPVLITHGDTLCTDDVAYQAFRTQTHNPQWQQHFLSQPIEVRLAMAQQARNASKAHQSDLKTNTQQFETITDVNPAAVTELMQRYGISTLIHGHTHRPAIHHLENNAKRIVLGDWYKQGSVLYVDEDGYRLEVLSLS